MTEDAINAETDQEIARFQDLFKKNSIAFTASTKEKPGHFFFTGIPLDQEGKVKDLIDRYTQDWDVSFVGDRMDFNLKTASAQFLRDQAVSQTLETLRNRIDVFGVAEPLLQRQGADRLVVELPGVEIPSASRASSRSRPSWNGSWSRPDPPLTKTTLLSASGGTVPPDAEVVRGDTKRTEGAYYLVDKVAAVGARTSALSAALRTNGTARLSLSRSAPRVRGGSNRSPVKTSASPSPSFSITKSSRRPASRTGSRDSGIIRGRFTAQEADDLVVVLKAGALPAGIQYLEERTIGPALGTDSIREGLSAGLVAVVAVMGFMLFYYRLSGLNAIAALLLNVLILFGALGYFRATLTLPGIAGIILSIGMAVDANVLIFERIKEELALGKGVRNAISQGFSRAFSAIFDSNLTTIISAVFLFQFGTGPIKGYAVTLIAGLVANLFTAVFVSRVIFDVTVPKTAKRLSV